MSYLLEILGRGLVSHLTSVFDAHLPCAADDDLGSLMERLEQSPRSADLAVRLGRLHLRSGQLYEAQKAFGRALELSDDVRTAAIGLACVHDELGDGPRTLERLRQAQSHDPQDPALAYSIALCHEREGHTDAARSAYRNAIRICPRLRNGYERLAAIALQDLDWDEALACYEQLHDLEPQNVDILLTQGALFLQNQRPEEAVERFQLALLVEPECEDMHLPEPTADASVNGLEKMIGELERIIVKYPDIAMYRVRLADLYSRRGDDDAALLHYRAALTTAPNFLEATVKLGTHHLRAGRLIAAAQTFNHAAELNDRLTLSFVALGVAQHAAGALDESDATLKLAASIEPSSSLLLAETSRLHLKSQRCGAGDEDSVGALTSVETPPVDETTFEDVLQRHRRAQATRPTQADVSYRFGVLLRQCGRGADAMRAFQDAIEINPYYAQALIKLGICCRESGDAAAGLRRFQQALLVEDAPILPHYELGLLFAQPSKFHLAVEEFSHPIGADGSLQAQPASLRLALQNIGLIDRVAATWRSLDELAHDPDDTLQKRRAIAIRENPA